MNYAKIDPALVAALDNITDDAAAALPVSVELEGDAGAPSERALTRLGLARGGRVRAATLSALQVGELSDEPWVRRLRLSRPLRLVDRR